MKNSKIILPLGIIAIGCAAAVVTGLQSRKIASGNAPADAITATGTAQGMDGDVSVSVVFDSSKIYSLTVTEQNETPNIGTNAVDQLPGAIAAAGSLKVDTVSGATVTSKAILQAAANAISSQGMDPATFGYGDASAAKESAPAAEAPADAKTAEGTAKGMDGDVKVKVVFDDSKVYSLEVVEQNETPNVGTMAVDQLPGAIAAAGSLKVDTVSGATITSKAILQAAANAIASEGVDPKALGFDGDVEVAAKAETTAAAEPAKTDVPADAKTAEGTAQGMDGDVKVEVTLTKDKIYSVKVTEQNETPNVGTKAIDELPAVFAEKNSINVDAVSGATVTSNALKEAVENAIKEAGFDPANFK